MATPLRNHAMHRLAGWGLPGLGLMACLLVSSPARAAETHQVETTGVKAKVGEKGATSVVITGRNGWHVNEEAPVTIKLLPGQGIAVDKNRLTKTDLVERTQDRARFDVAFTASEPGPRTINAEASFVMCQAAACKPVKETIALAVDVADPKAAPAAAKPRKKK